MSPALIKKKYVVPGHQKINLIGMLIGPKGMYHKMLEELSGCIMFIKGKASDGSGAGSSSQPTATIDIGTKSDSSN